MKSKVPLKNRLIITCLSLIAIGLVTTCEKEESNNYITDIDGNKYSTVTIGSQVWLVENLKATRYNDGKAIPLVTENNAWGALSTPAYCWYDNDEGSHKNTYGALYNWYAVETGKLCPDGWHVPSDLEWKQMEMHLGMSQAEADDTGFRGTNEGGKLKETGTAHWESPNEGATNESGFTALPGGSRVYNGVVFEDFERGGNYWCHTEYDPNLAWRRYIYYDYTDICRDAQNKKYGFSVRCVKD